MIAPWCERECAEPLVARLGVEALDFWTRDIPVATVAGTLVLAPPREAAELTDFARRTEQFGALDADGIATLEPDLAGRFNRALYFPSEAHLDPRRALAALDLRLAGLPNVVRRFGVDAETLPPAPD